VEAFQRKLARRLDHRKILHRCLDLPIHEDLPVSGFAAKTGRQIDHRSDGRIVDSPLEADAAERGIAVRNADAEAEVMPVLAPGD
jgi:hypothetical protein